MLPPKPKQMPKVLISHGDKREDSYYWMNYRDHKEVLSYIEKENQYFDFMMKSSLGLRKKIFREIKRRIPERESTVPYRSKNYFYFVKYKKNKEYPVYCRRKVNERKIKILIDVNEQAENHDYYDLSSMSLSFSHHLLSFCVDTTGRRIYTVYFKDLKKNKILSQKINNTTSNVIWANDNQNLFYATQDVKTLRSNRIFRYNLKTQKRTLVFEEKDSSFSVGVYKTLSKKFIFIQSSSTLTTECRFIRADKPQSQFKIFKKRRRGHKYYVVDGENTFYILTNSKNCKNYRLDQASVHHYKNWKNVFPYRSDIYLEDFEVFKKFIAFEVRKAGLTEIMLFDRKTKAIHFLPFKSGGHFVELGDNAQYKTDTIRFEYESMTTLCRVYDYHFFTKKRKLIRKKKIAGGFFSQKYQSQSLMVKARDGVHVPLSLLYRKDLFKKKTNPLFLYGYGAYGYSTEPGFYPHIFSLVDRGFVFAIAHVRGGAELGKFWHDEGRVLNKKNTFFDFIDCSRYLIQEGYVHSKKLYAGGGSAGGLLMGAVINMCPHLYKGLVVDVPFVDVLTTMMDKNIPLTAGEYDEWGDPRKKKIYDYIKSYSPYDNIQTCYFPHVLVTSGYHDSQVQYWEPLKWVCRLRQFQKARKPILLYMDMGAGHSGATGRFKRLHLLALKYAFLLHLEGK